MSCVVAAEDDATPDDDAPGNATGGKAKTAKERRAALVAEARQAAAAKKEARAAEKEAKAVAKAEEKKRKAEEKAEAKKAKKPKAKQVHLPTTSTPAPHALCPLSFNDCQVRHYCYKTTNSYVSTVSAPKLLRFCK